MGAFKFIPQPGETYTAKITKPEGIKETVGLIPVCVGPSLRPGRAEQGSARFAFLKVECEFDLTVH